MKGPSGAYHEVSWPGRAAVLQVIEVQGIVGRATHLGGVVAFIHAVGDVVQEHGVIARVYGSDPGPLAPSSTFLNLDRHPNAQPLRGVLVLRVDSPLFYANATLVRDRVRELVGAAHPLPEVVILELGASDELDVTTAETLDELATTLHAARIEFALADVHRPVIDIARHAGLIEAIGGDHFFSTVEGAVETLRTALRPICLQTRNSDVPIAS